MRAKEKGQSLTVRMAAAAAAAVVAEPDRADALVCARALIRSARKSRSTKKKTKQASKGFTFAIASGASNAP